jgi:ABC-type glycerol-3-phosphate transport system substrate-binding protein
MRLLPLLLILMAFVAAGCGQSKSDKAMAQVCSARDSITKQVDDLKNLTITSATTSQVTDSLQAIQKDLQKIGDARKDLSDANREQVDKANQAFAASVRKTFADVGTKTSLQDAATQLKAAFQDLADSYRNTFGQISCS